MVNEDREAGNMWAINSLIQVAPELELYFECYRDIEELWTEKF